MEYQTIQDHLQNVLSYTELTPLEKKVMTIAYLCPGKTTEDIITDSESTQSTIEALQERGFLLCLETEQSQRWYPGPIALLPYKKNLQDNCKKKLDGHLFSVDKWIQYPQMRSLDTRLKNSSDENTLMKWLFDFHSTDWNRVYCFGDYESFIENIGFETEMEWIKERAKKSRTAMVVATHDGQWARRIDNAKDQELRDCLINPQQFDDIFIMSFPEIKTTVIGGGKSLTCIHSSTVAHQYAALVEQNMITM